MYKSKININITVIILICTFLSLVYSFIVGEDSIGGASNDYKHHLNLLGLFSNDLILGIKNFDSELNVRNSPFFYIIFGQFVKFGLDLDNLKYLNTFSLLIILVYFKNCLRIKFKYLEKVNLYIIISIIFLSPTIRSLLNYPYPYIWGLALFTISIYYFLKFKLKESNFKNSFLTILFISLSAYFTPNFAFFYLYYIFEFFKKFKNSNNFIFLVLFSISISIPALLFLVWKDFYILKAGDGLTLSSFDKFNIFNKFVIIITVIYLFFLPFLNPGKLIEKFSNISINKNSLILFLFFVINIYFFNFKGDIGGGGIFYQISNLIFKNNYFLFVIFFLSLLTFYTHKLINKNNLFIFFILILYNSQYTIYYKYFDPLILLIILFFLKLDNLNKLNLNKLSKNIFLFYVFFLVINIFKVSIKNNLINLTI